MLCINNVNNLTNAVYLMDDLRSDSADFKGRIIPSDKTNEIVLQIWNKTEVHFVR